MGIIARRRIIPAPTLINRDNWQEDLEITLTGALKAVNALNATAGTILRFANSDSAQLVPMSDAVAGLLNAASVSAFVASLGTIPANQLPAIAITDTFTVGSQAAMLALSAQRGDIAVRSDLNKCYVLAADDPTVLANWTLLLTPTDAVLSVAGLTGAISASALKTALAIARTDISGLGTAAALDVGTTANKIVQLTAAGKLPAVDGSQLTNLPFSSASPTFTGTMTVEAITASSKVTLSGTEGNQLSWSLGGQEWQLRMVSNGSWYLWNQTAGLPFFSAYKSGGFYIGASPSDPGANNLSVQGTVFSPFVSLSSASATKISLNSPSGASNNDIQFFNNNVSKWIFTHRAFTNGDQFWLYNNTGGAAIIAEDATLYIAMPGVYARTTGLSPNIAVDSSGNIMRSTVAVAPLASPTFTGTPAAPTAAGGTNTTQIATTAFVQTAVAGAGVIPSSSTLPVGAYAFCQISAALSDGATTSGANVKIAMATGGSLFGGATQTGTWKNISGAGTIAGDYGLMVRTA